jgi:proline racemase
MPPLVKGSAYVMAVSSLVLSEGDPFPVGFDLEGEEVEE